MRAILFLVALTAALVMGCSSSANGLLVSGAGKFAPKVTDWELDVSANGQYKVFHRNQPGNSFSTHDWQPTNGWFLYIEDNTRLWTFNGDKELYVYLWKGEGEKASIGRYDSTYYQGELPRAVAEALPMATREQIISLWRKSG